MARAPSERRHVRRASKARRRGGAGRGPLRVQRLARGVVDTAVTAKDVGVAAVSGDRPYVIALVGILIAGALMLAAPLQTFLDGRSRVELLETQLAALDGENTTLQQRADDLGDHDTIELLAREELGMIKPGEVPYAIIPPEVDRPQIAMPREVEAPAPAWYRRWWDAVVGLFG